MNTATDHASPPAAMTISPEERIRAVDGLRAYAVLAVLLFHAFPSIAPGGFIGVDIFFVISGFVISRSYLFALIDRRVTLRDFYMRRIRRLVPAYVLMIVATTLVAFLLLEPRLLRNFSNSLLAQTFYVQNFTFWIEGDYFDKAITKPLLHTWSLAVEEQFYLLLGVAVLVLRRWPRLLIPAVAVASILSLALGMFISGSSPKTSFFLLPARLWEFALGIGAFLVCRRLPVRPAKALHELVAYAGLAALVACIFLFSEAELFPGPHALIACLVTAVLCAMFHARPGRGYSPFVLPPVRYVGKISYSLYLWHWPLIVFASMLLGRSLWWPEGLAAVAASILIAALAHRLVEMPVRRSALLPTRNQLLSAAAAASIAFIVVGSFGVLTSGAAFRYSEPMRSLFLAAQEHRQYRCGMMFRVLNPNRETCESNSTRGSGGVLVIGDSHADRIDDMIGDIGAARGVPVLLTVRNCDIEQFMIRRDCSARVLQRVIDEAKSRSIRTVLLSSYWFEPLQYDDFVRPITALRDAGLQVVFSEVVPSGSYFNPTIRAEALLSGTTTADVPVTRADYATQVADQDAVFERLRAEFPGTIEILRPGSFLCGEGLCDRDTNARPNYVDGNHLSELGLTRVRPMYEQWFDALSAGQMSAGASDQPLH